MCLISFINHNEDIILFKNRDRIYNAKIKIVHQIINNVEIAFIYDVDTNWIEGINEYGIGLINSALLVKIDEHEGPINRGFNKGTDGKKILYALTKKNLKNAIISTLIYRGDSKIPLMGHTILANSKIGIHIERTTKEGPYFKKLKYENIVLSNHGIKTDSGYKKGRKRKSSVVRKKIIELELDNIEKNSNIFELFNKKYKNLDPRLNPYRNRKNTMEIIKNKNSKIFSTTSQIMLNLSKKILNVKIDKNNCTLINIENKLPPNYNPKIIIKISFTEFNDSNLHELKD